MRHIVGRTIAINVDATLEHCHFTNRLASANMAHEFATPVAHGLERTERAGQDEKDRI